MICSSTPTRPPSATCSATAAASRTTTRWVPWRLSGAEPQRVWTPTELLELVPTERTPPGSTFSYAETNYLLLQVVIEHLRERPLADVLRDGALAVDGVERLVHQPE